MEPLWKLRRPDLLGPRPCCWQGRRCLCRGRVSRNACTKVHSKITDSGCTIFHRGKMEVFRELVKLGHHSPNNFTTAQRRSRAISPVMSSPPGTNAHFVSAERRDFG